MSLKTRVENLKISVLTVCKNSELTIEKTIQSVINQEYQNIEYIIVDGLSKDNTLQIVDKYKKHIRYTISENDSGIYDAINKGIKRATGDLIGILNSDDQYFPNTLSLVAKKYDGKSIVSGYCVISNGLTGQISTKKGKRFQKEKPLNSLKYRMAIDHPAMFVPAELYKSLGLYDTKYKISADYKWTTYAYHKGVNFIRIKEPFVLFSLGGASHHGWITSTLENRAIQKELNILNPIKANFYVAYRILNFLKTFTINRFKRMVHA